MKRPEPTLKHLVLFSIIAPGIILLPIHFWITPLTTEALPEFYSKNFRASLFSGFLTLGGFLFSLKTFIVIKMKENVYDNERYKENFETQKKLNPKLTLYAPLKRLSDLLFWTVFSSLITAFSQFTIGAINNWATALICIWLATFTVILFLSSLIQIKSNLNYWFHYLDKPPPPKTK